LSEYSVNPDVPQVFFDATTDVSTKLTRRITFTASGTASYAPYYNFAPFAAAGSSEPSLSIPDLGLAALTQPEFGFAAIADPVITATGAFGITDTFTKRSSLSIRFDGRESRLPGDNAGRMGDIGTYEGRAIFTHHYTRAMGVHLGYGREVASYGSRGAPPTHSDLVDAGLDYSGSIARRTTLSLATSTAVVRWADANQFRLNGNAAVTRGIGRTWDISTTYVRGLDFLSGFQAPVLTDSFNGSIGGLIAPRVNWRAGLGWTRGEVGFDAADAFIVYSAQSEIRYALTRKLAAFARGGYYRYELPPASTTLALLSHFERQTISVGLRAWLPILTRERTRP
jgi:hypothetical protein